MTPTFQPWPKTPRLFRDCIITEKIDGTNAAVIVTEDGQVAAQSRRRLITPEADNFGFAAWVHEHADELRALGPGHHYGEWYGRGIQRGYGLNGRRFALFDSRWASNPDRPLVCDVVPTLYVGPFDSGVVRDTLERLQCFGSFAVPGWMDPEGVVVWHRAAGQAFKAFLADLAAEDAAVWCVNYEDAQA